MIGGTLAVGIAALWLCGPVLGWILRGAVDRGRRRRLETALGVRSFRDRHGVEWHLRIDVGTLRAVRDRTGLDLLALSIETLDRLGNPMILFDVLWTLCEAQALGAGMSVDEFGERLAGDALPRAAEAFWETLNDFFRRGRGIGNWE